MSENYYAEQARKEREEKEKQAKREAAVRGKKARARGRGGRSKDTAPKALAGAVVKPRMRIVKVNPDNPDQQLVMSVKTPTGVDADSLITGIMVKLRVRDRSMIVAGEGKKPSATRMEFFQFCKANGIFAVCLARTKKDATGATGGETETESDPVREKQNLAKAAKREQLRQLGYSRERIREEVGDLPPEVAGNASDRMTFTVIPTGGDKERVAQGMQSRRDAMSILLAQPFIEDWSFAINAAIPHGIGQGGGTLTPTVQRRISAMKQEQIARAEDRGNAVVATAVDNNRGIAVQQKPFAHEEEQIKEVCAALDIPYDGIVPVPVQVDREWKLLDSGVKGWEQLKTHNPLTGEDEYTIKERAVDTPVKVVIGEFLRIVTEYYSGLKIKLADFTGEKFIQLLNLYLQNTDNPRVISIRKLLQF